MTLHIRPATPADCPAIAAMILELAEYERLAHACFATPEALQAALFAPRPVAHCVMGECDGVVQGFALYFFNFSTFLAKPGLYLEDLYVRPEARSKGLGKGLITHLAAIAVQEGCGRMEWSVLDWNAPAIAFYRSLGAEAMDEWTIYRLTGPALTTTARLALTPSP